MERVEISSSNIKSAGYDTEEQLLEIEFNSGAVYSYAGVPMGVYDDLLEAESVGKYFNQSIKNAGYTCKRL